MGYYEDKVPPVTMVDPTALILAAKEWIEELQAEVKRASRQIDKLERKLLRRAQRLGRARLHVNNTFRSWALSWGADSEDERFEALVAAAADLDADEDRW